ncbi:MAG: hypothetical protein AAFO04_25420 [Cyanobacteria bacterium J06592_8]
MPKLSYNDPSRWSYSTTGIIKRTGLTRREVEQLRREAKEEASDPLISRERDGQTIKGQDYLERKNKTAGIDLSKETTQKRRGVGVVDLPFSAEVDEQGFKSVEGKLPGGAGRVSWDREGEKGVSAGGFGVGVKPDGGGSVEFPGGISIDYVVRGCFVVEVYKLFGVITHSNIQKKPGCEEGGEDDGGDEEKEKPPHCIGSGGKKMGGGKPEHQLPECADDGKSHRFVYYFSYINEASFEYKRKVPDNSPKSGYFHAIMSEPKCEPTPLDAFGGRVLPYGFRLDEYAFDESISGEVLRESKRNFTSRMTGFFTGTFAEFKEHLGPPKDETVTTENQNTGDVTVRRSRQWNTAIICEDGYDCNPTGNEGCDSSSSGDGNGNNRKGDEPNQRTPKNPGKPGNSKNDSGEDDKMSKCCEDTKELLMMVLDSVGYNLSPIEVPGSLVDDEGEGQVPYVLPNLASFVIWWFGRWDEVTGQFPQKIEVEDIDPLKGGNQSETFILANQAEAFTEIYSQVITVLIQQQIQLDMMHRTMLTAGLNRESGVRIEEMVDAVIDYLGFDVKDVNTKIPQLFTVNKNNWDEILDESNSTVKTLELTGKANLQSSLMELLQAAAITRAVHFRKVNPNGDPKKEIYSSLVNSLTNASKVASIMNNSEDWDSFLNWLKTQNKDVKITEQNIGDFNRDG